MGLYLALPVLLFTGLRCLLLGRLAQAPQPDLPVPAVISLPLLLFAKYLEVLLYPFSMLVTYSDTVNARLAAFWLYLPLAAAAFLLFSGLAALLRARGSGAAALGLAWVWIALLPVLNIVPLTFYMAERLTYLPLAGLAIGAAAAARGINTGRGRILLWAGCAALLTAFTLNIQRRLPVWHDDISLWRYDAEKNPGNSLTRLRLAEALRTAGHLPGAYAELKRALGLAADNRQRAIACNELGTLHAANNDLKTAKRFFLAAAALNPGSNLAFYNLAKAYALERDMAAARNYLVRSLELDRTYAPAMELAASLSERP